MILDCHFNWLLLNLKPFSYVYVLCFAKYMHKLCCNPFDCQLKARKLTSKLTHSYILFILVVLIILLVHPNSVCHHNQVLYFLLYILCSGFNISMNFTAQKIFREYSTLLIFSKTHFHHIALSFIGQNN